jgi:glycosyltransferase involved in cell wall biosynthesis
MNVAHILNHLSDSYAGVSIGTRGMVKALSRLGIGTSVWATDDHEETGLLDEEIRCHVYKAKWPTGWRRSPDLASALDMASRNLDLFHVHTVWSHPQYLAAKIAGKKSIPYIVAPRASLEPWRMNHKRFKKDLYLKLLGNKLIRNATCLHAVATNEVNDIRNVGYRGPVFVVHNGIITEEFKNLPDPVEAEKKWSILQGRRVVLYLSRLSPEKGLDELIPAWSAVVKKPSYSDAMLVLAGPDDRGYRLRVEAMIQEAGIETHTLLTGLVKGRDKFALMSRADIYTLPSYSEGFSNSLLENLAAGTPVLISPACNFPEVTEARAGLCVETQREALSEALMRLLDMPKDKLIYMGKNGRRLVMEHYTWDIAARKIATVYCAILKMQEIPLHPDPIQVDLHGKALFDAC